MKETVKKIGEKRGSQLGEASENERILVREMTYGVSSSFDELIIQEVDTEQAYLTKMEALFECYLEK